MTFRDDLGAANAKITELERIVQERERTIAELEEVLRAGSPQEHHKVRVRQLETALANERAENAALRSAPKGGPSSGAPWRDQSIAGFIVLAVVIGLCVLVQSR